MTEYPEFSYSMGDVRRAGETIAGPLAWSEETAPAIGHAFEVANSWRESHAYPMRSVRWSVIHYMFRAEVEGITAARLKRMQAIRRKLSRSSSNFNLNGLQDLGGCRAIMDDIHGVKSLVETIRKHVRHEIRGEDDYINNPKADGYRSHHMKLSFNPKDNGRRVFKGRRIELQVRTRLQHSWATAVEAVGLFRGEDFKVHQGSPDWLRLFELISAEFAEQEGCPLPPSSLTKGERIEAIEDFTKRTDALSVLEQIRHGVRGTDIPLIVGYRPTHFLITYDHASKTVSVEAHRMVKDATQSYGNAEAFTNAQINETQTIVLVEVSKIESLKSAYPNYFGDVEFFSDALRQIIRQGGTRDYAIPPRQPPKKPLDKHGDMSWLRQRRFWSPGGINKKPE